MWLPSPVTPSALLQYALRPYSAATLALTGTAQQPPPALSCPPTPQPPAHQAPTAPPPTPPRPAAHLCRLAQRCDPRLRRKVGCGVAGQVQQVPLEAGAGQLLEELVGRRLKHHLRQERRKEGDRRDGCCWSSGRAALTEPHAQSYLKASPAQAASKIRKSRNPGGPFQQCLVAARCKTGLDLGSSQQCTDLHWPQLHCCMTNHDHPNIPVQFASLPGSARPHARPPILSPRLPECYP
jgi:hypothetical protein